jgi:hypothetical protein
VKIIRKLQYLWRTAMWFWSMESLLSPLGFNWLLLHLPLICDSWPLQSNNG